MSEEELNSYRLTSMEEPTDEMLERIIAELGDAAAQCALDKCLNDESNPLNDKKEAFELFQKTTKQDDSEAIYHLGVCLSGNGDDASKSQ